ncbi:putative F-box protein At5g60060 [Lycium ferocissimum]|uniref:putative F-box protein At5g60060 n=1 Tax=Lycium ferocissimum TaxID=112874 RepID=UPI0028156B88|nr:putative F-box protein At5g60060 [Lycium ferocissimum]
MSMVSGTLIPWSDLPKELVKRISKGLDTYIDVLRLRAVCTTWRSSIPPFKNSPSLPLKLQVPILPEYTSPYGRNPDFYLIESTVYLFQPLDDGGTSVNNNPSSSRGWLVKIMQTVDGKLRLVNPLNHKTIQVLPEDVPNKVLNLLDFRVFQVCKSYHVQYVDRSRPCFDEDHDVGHLVSKILLMSTNYACSSTRANHYFSLMAIHSWGQLCYFKSGDEKWTKLKDRSCEIDDIIVYKGDFCAVNRYGETTKFDSLLNETKVASRLHNTGGKKYRLVESSGQLFLVDMSSWLDTINEIKLYRLDEQQHEWTIVHTLGDRIFFAGDDCCFSVSAKDFGDCRGNCIYYTAGGIHMDILKEDGDCDRRGGWYSAFSRGHGPSFVPSGITFGHPVISSNADDKNEGGSKSGGLSEELVHKYKGLHGHSAGVFNIEDGKLGSLLSFLEYADIFWPPPSWLNRQDQEIKTNKQEVAES